MNKYFQKNTEIEEKSYFEEIIIEIFLKKENKIKEFSRNRSINLFDDQQKSLDKVPKRFLDNYRENKF